ncbi:MAG: penicillin-binding protein activator LpoB [Alphaproteobacteria bacterium]|nr:penicillin-binding protein activator LpoB [Alphaproteobacteria bacterium]
MKNFLKIITLSFLLTACNSTKVIDLNDAEQKADMDHVMSMEYRDFERAANEAVADMLASGAVTNPNGGRYVLVVSRITNDTMQRIDTDELVKKIRTQLLRSGKVVVTNAVGLDGAEDPMVMKARQLRKSKEFNQANVAGKGNLVAPDLSLSGKLIQKNLKIKQTFGSKERVEYYIQLSLTDINSGLALWENETPIIKEGKDAPKW